MRFRKLILASLLGLFVFLQISCNKLYKVKFYVDNSLYDYQLVVRGGNAQTPIIPTKTGYVFVGWDKEFININSDIKINAIFEKLDYEEILDAESTYLKENFNNFIQGGALPVLGIHESKIIWYSNSLSIGIDDEGKITVKETDDDVIITAMIEYFDCVDYQSFEISIA